MAEQEQNNSKKPGQTAEHTSERPENQVKAAPRTDTLPEDIRKMQGRVEALLSEKERYMLSFVFSKVPRPYYIRWRDEANAIFAQTVAIDVRRRAILAKRQAAKKPA